MTNRAEPDRTTDPPAVRPHQAKLPYSALNQMAKAAAQKRISASVKNFGSRIAAISPDAVYPRRASGKFRQASASGGL